MANATITVNGHLGKDATQRATKTGKTVTTFPLASTPRLKTNDEWVDGETMWFTVSVWGAIPEILFTKGVHALVTGTLIKKTYTGDDGITRESLCINADTVAIVPTTTNTNNTPAPTNWEPISTPTQTTIDTPF